MKRDIAWYMERCLTCWKIKAEHQRPHAKLQPLGILMWKWELITMDFITKMLRITNGFDPISVIVDHLTKSVHFLDIQESSSTKKLVNVYIREIVSHHRVLVYHPVLVSISSSLTLEVSPGS